MKKTDWTGSWFWAVLITVGLGWHGVCLADEKTATDKRMFTQYLVSEAPVSGYDEEEREQVIAAAFKQLITKQLIAKVGKEADTQSFCAQVAAQNPMLYVERYGYMTRYKLPTKSRVGSKTVGHISSETESALIENDADANLHLRIRWNMQAVNQLLQELTTEGAALSQNSDKSRLNSSPSLVGDATNGDLSKKEGGEISSTAKADTQNSQLGDIETAVKLTSVEDVRRPLVLLWLNCRDEGGHYRLVEDRLVDEDIALVEFLRRGAKHKGIELLFPVLGEREREETSNIDWINASNRQAVLRASKRYATDLILIGNVRKRLLSGMWQGDWRFWNGKQWAEYQATARNRGGVILALWEWLAGFEDVIPAVGHAEQSESGPVLVKLKVSQVDSMELSKEVMEYLRDVSSLIHGIELLTLRADGIELRFTFEGTKVQLLTLLRGNYGVVLDSVDSCTDGDHDVERGADEQLVLSCRWIKQ